MLRPFHLAGFVVGAALPLACGQHGATVTATGAGGASGAGTSSATGGAGGADAGPGLCKTAPLVVPTTNFFTDVSQKSGIQDQNFVVEPKDADPHQRPQPAGVRGHQRGRLRRHRHAQPLPQPSGGGAVRAPGAPQQQGRHVHEFQRRVRAPQRAGRVLPVRRRRQRRGRGHLRGARRPARGGGQRAAPQRRPGSLHGEGGLRRRGCAGQRGRGERELRGLQRRREARPLRRQRANVVHRAGPNLLRQR